MTGKEIVTAAKKELGVKEYPFGSNKVKYNTWYYGKEVSGDKYPWCVVFIIWLFRFCLFLIKRTASSSDLLRWFRSKGQLVKDPKPGDIVFFKFDKDADCEAQHVGLVSDVAQWPKSIKSIEGNTSITSNDNGGSVMERVRSKSIIVAFARPAYDDADYNSVTNTINVPKPTLKMGSKGDWVKVAQSRLFINGYHIEVDGDFGPNTKNAVIAFQASYGLVKDGIIGPKTWAKLYPS